MRYSLPATGYPDPLVISTMSRASVGELMVSNGQTAASAIFPVASTAFFYPFFLTQRHTYRRALWMNGATVSGNVDIGVYTTAGIKVATLGSTAQAGVSTIQVSVAISWVLDPGRYFLGFACDNITATFVRLSPNATSLRAGGIRVRATSFALPTDVSSWAGFTGTAFVPLAGLSELDTI